MKIPSGQMAFIDDMEVDERATANAAGKFLDKGFEKYLRRAGWNRSSLKTIDESHISSPSMDASGVATHGGINSAERSMVDIIEAKHICIAVYKAIMACQDFSKKPYRKILRLSFLECLEDYKISNLIGYSERRTVSLKRQALCEFADLFETYRIEYNIDDSKELRLLKFRKVDIAG